MNKVVKQRLKEFGLTFVGGLIVSVLFLSFMWVIVYLDDSENHCASKIAAKIYDENCF